MSHDTRGVRDERGSAHGPDASRGAPGIDAVVCDYGNVIYTWEAMAAVAGHVPAAVWEDFVTNGDFARWNAMCDAGVRLDVIEARLRQACPDRTQWHEAYHTYLERFALSLTGPVPGTAAVLEDLLAGGVPMYLLSNFNSGFFAATAHLCPLLGKLDGRILLSGDVGVTKPDPVIFRLALERLGLQAQRTLFIDDSADNIASAQALGFQVHHFQGAGRLRAHLCEAGLLGA